MKKSFLPAILSFFLLACLTDGYGQNTYLPKFLKEKQTWDEKIVVVYAPSSLQSAVKEQLNVLYQSLSILKNEKIVVVQLPVLLSASNIEFLDKKLKMQSDRLNIWVFDEKGQLRMTSTKVTPVKQILRVLDIEMRPQVVASTRVLMP